MTPDPICCVCLRLIDRATGQVAQGWEQVKWLAAPGDDLCGACKDPIIDGLSKAVPCS